MPKLVTGGLYQLVLPTPFPVGPVNCYISTRSPITLVDTGTKWEPSLQELKSQLAELDLSLERIERLVITHPHADHYGLASQIVSASGAQVFSHPVNESALCPTAQHKQMRDEFCHQLMLESGVPADQVADFMAARVETRPYAEPVCMDCELNEGDTVKLGDAEWNVLHTPGHSGGLICLYQPECRVLLSNDHLLRNISSNAIVEPDHAGGPRPHRLVQYLYHLERIASLHASIAWTGHGGEITDVNATVRKRLRLHERRADHILTLLQEQSLSAYQLSHTIFGTRHGFDTFLALSETIGHLDLLLEQSKIFPTYQAGITFWTAAV